MSKIKKRPVRDKMPHLRRSLRQTFGIEGLRSGQDEVIRAVMNHRDTLAIMPTGVGKSLCYQLPTLHLEGTTISEQERPAATLESKAGVNAAAAAELQLSVGDEVSLPKYSRGLVEEIEEGTLLVRLPDGKSRKFKREFARPVSRLRQKM